MEIASYILAGVAAVLLAISLIIMRRINATPSPSYKEEVPHGNIDISDLNKAAVLAALYNGSQPKGMGFLEYTESKMTIEEARKILKKGQTYFDYLKGRAMKVNLGKESFNPRGYDEYNGSGSSKVIIDELRRDGVTDGVMTTTIHEHGRMHAANDASEHLGGKTQKTGPHSIELGFGEASDEVSKRIEPYLRPQD